MEAVVENGTHNLFIFNFLLFINNIPPNTPSQTQYYEKTNRLDLDFDNE